LNQFHLTPVDLREYESIYPGAAKDIVTLISKTLDDQALIDKLIAGNEKVYLITERFKVFIGALLSIIFVICGCYLVSKGLEVIGVLLILAVALSAYDFRILKFLKIFFKK
jgi:uncharacterized membrane protein